MARSQLSQGEITQHSSTDPSPTSNSNPSGVQTRRKRYEYSHTKPPVVAPPPRSTTRPPVPESAARKRRKTRNTDPDAQDMPADTNVGVSTELGDSNSNIASTESEPQPSGLLSAMAHEEPRAADEAPANQDDGPRPNCQSLDVIPEEEVPSGLEQRPSAPSEMEAEAIGHDPSEHADYAHKTPGKHPDIQVVQPTPDRTNSQAARTWGQGTPAHPGPSIAISGPSPFAVRAPPPWNLDFGDESESILNPTIQFNRSLPIPFPSLSTLNAPAIQFPALSPSLQGPNSPIAQRQIANGAPQVTATNITTNTLGLELGDSHHDSGVQLLSQVPTFPPQQVPMTSSDAPPPTNNHLSIPDPTDFERRSVSPGIFATQTNSSSSNSGVNNPVFRGATPQLLADSGLASLHTSILQGLQPSIPPVPFVSRLSPAPAAMGLPSTLPSQSPTPVMRPVSVAPSRATTPATDHHAQSTASGGNQIAQPGKTRDDFNLDEHLFNEQMKPRWQWYLIVENAFPVDLSDAQEACIAYAEEMLGIPRSTIGNVRRGFSYVRAKDSRMRYEFQRGVLSNVEGHYGVKSDGSSRQKIQDLIKHSNFMYSAFNPTNISMVVGRCRHPCISTVMLSVLFPSKSRGQPPGVRFIRHLIAVTPQESLWEYQDKGANYGAPVALMALACTLILHALRLLELGYSSTDDSMKKKKPIVFDEATYGDYYRKLVKKLKAYPRLGELRRFHMTGLLQEYTNRHKNGIAKDLLVADDDIERFSDGE